MANKFGPACIAPALTDASLARYEELAASAPAEVKDAMQVYLKCVKMWWDLPESTGKKTPIMDGLAHIQNLDEPIKQALWELIPWPDEMVAYAKRFDAIDPVKEKELRDAAFHLHWYVKNLNLDREPPHKEVK